MSIHAIVCILLVTQIQDVTGQEPDDKWWNILMKDGLACKPETCRKSDETCECYLTIEHRLTMMEETSQSLLLPSEGRTVRFDDSTVKFTVDCNYHTRSITIASYDVICIRVLHGVFGLIGVNSGVVKSYCSSFGR
jgi:hypothetical protein